MNPTPLSEDIAYAISCVQDYRDTINADNSLGQFAYVDASERIERLFQFYYQLVGFDPNNIRKVTLNEID
jgi:hypothetical protein